VRVVQSKRSAADQMLYRITGVPETFIVDHAGNAVFFKASPITQAELSAVLERILNQ